jgi:hypothetical protein
MLHGVGVLLVALAPAPAQRPCLPDEISGSASSEPAAVAPPVADLPAPVAAPPPTPIPPALAQRERARYRVDYGPLSVGELYIAIGGASPGAKTVRAGGRGAGAVLGLGRMSNSIATDFDLERLDARRWNNARQDGDRALTDSAEQPTPGQVSGTRSRQRPQVRQTPMQATFPVPVLDPLAFVLRLRAAPPAPGAPQVLHVLDGQALWRVTISNAGRAALPDGAVGVPTFRLDAVVVPVHWNGTDDENGDRRRRSFSAWLSDDANRVPLRFEMPLGPSSVVVALTEISRRAPTP